ADISFNPHHPKEVSTPHMDALARDGVSFTQGYISGNVCSPTRAGLMLGRYQQRVGVYTAGEGGRGFDPTLRIFPGFLPDEYRTGAFGKWHLGLDEDYPELKWHPLSRGFDEFYGFMGRGAHDYFKLTRDYELPIYRNKERIDDQGYLTTRLTEEATAFIRRNKQQPFFVYLAYNAVHAPAQAPQEDIERYRKEFPDITPERAVLMAMLEHLDKGVGSVVNTLKDEGLWENTLLFFLTDNGGAKAMQANNGILRGFKSTDYEGGIRTPFVVSWPAKFEGGRTIDVPVISLDILPTTLDALHVEPPAGIEFDGRSLLPLLTGQTRDHHQTLYWSDGGSTGEWAVRHGDWKLYALRDQRELFNLAEDPSEATNLAEKQPERVQELTALYDAWLEQMAEPMTGEGKRWSAAAEATDAAASAAKQTGREAKRAQRKAQRDAERAKKKSNEE
ncbi:MAG: sulfatase-like hydrolase/transferase, partial [Planctomycetota bacterium]